MAVRHYNIPVFIPELACPHRCVFCNQNSITGQYAAPAPQEVADIITQHLATIPRDNTHIQIAFFGGSFTGIAPEMQERYLQAVAPFLQQGVQSIRLSTRPDYIDVTTLHRLKHYGVSHIELGAQSMDDEVLRLSGRGHKAAHVRSASELILSQGFTLGLQMMTGLPGDNHEKSIATAQELISCGATETRIYPTLVISGTALEKLYRQGKYRPQTLDEAVRLAAELYQLFISQGVKVLRVGLYPSEEISTGAAYIAGPFHPQFKELVLSELWKQKLATLSPRGKSLSIYVAPKALNHAIGYKKSNLLMLRQRFSKVSIMTDSRLNQMNYHVDYH